MPVLIKLYVTIFIGKAITQKLISEFHGSITYCGMTGKVMLSYSGHLGAIPAKEVAWTLLGIAL